MTTIPKLTVVSKKLACEVTRTHKQVYEARAKFQLLRKALSQQEHLVKKQDVTLTSSNSATVGASAELLLRSAQNERAKLYQFKREAASHNTVLDNYLGDLQKLYAQKEWIDKAIGKELRLESHRYESRELEEVTTANYLSAQNQKSGLSDPIERATLPVTSPQIPCPVQSSASNSSLFTPQNSNCMEADTSVSGGIHQGLHEVREKALKDQECEIVMVEDVNGNMQIRGSLDPFQRVSVEMVTTAEIATKLELQESHLRQSLATENVKCRSLTIIGNASRERRKKDGD